MQTFDDFFKVDEISVHYRPMNFLREHSVVNKSSDAFKVLRQFFPAETIQMQEQFVVLYLNNANRVIGGYKASVGGLTSTVVDVRLVMSVGLKALASAIVICHNHPSGNLSPSDADKNITNKLKEAGKLIDIRLTDHLIINAEGDYYSFADDGLI